PLYGTAGPRCYPIPPRRQALRPTAQTSKKAHLPREMGFSRIRYRPRSDLLLGPRVGEGQQGIACDEVGISFEPAAVLVDPRAVGLLTGEEFGGQFLSPVMILPFFVGKR